MVVAATGFFDGVHAGHRAVLQVLNDMAAAENKESAVVTFWPHPRNVLQQDAFSLRLLNTLEEKKKLVLDLGVDKFFVIPFTKDFSRLDTRQFMKEYLIDRYEVSKLIIGYDHKLGYVTGGEQEGLVEIASSLGMETAVVKEVSKTGRLVSSTKIRNILSEGNIADANSLLGYRYSLFGVVVVGNMIGRRMGFPTANMQLYEPLKLVPGNGVYHVKATLQGVEYDGICNIGNRPTVTPGNQRTIETHILDFDEDIYGLDIRIQFISRIRSEQKFASMDELKYRISQDELYVRNLK